MFTKQWSVQAVGRHLASASDTGTSADLAACVADFWQCDVFINVAVMQAKLVPGIGQMSGPVFAQRNLPGSHREQDMTAARLLITFSSNLCRLYMGCGLMGRMRFNVVGSRSLPHPSLPPKGEGATTSAPLVGWPVVGFFPAGGGQGVGAGI